MLAFMVLALSLGSFAGAPCEGNEAEILGTQFGESLLELAMFLANRGVAVGEEYPSFARCYGSEPEDPLFEQFCERFRRLDEITAAITQANSDGCLNEEARYELTLGFFMFRELERGLDDPNPLVRGHALEQIYTKCDHPSMLTPQASSACPSEVEEACLKTLVHDEEARNRKLALVVLSDGYATSRSRGTLLELKPELSPEERQLVDNVLVHIQE